MNDILVDLTAHQWLPAAILILGYVSTLLSPDSTFPISIPARWRPVEVIVLGQGLAVLEAIAGGRPWITSIEHGLFVSFITLGLGAALKQAFFPSGDPANPTKIQALLLWFLRLALVPSKNKASTVNPPPLPLLLMALFCTACIPAATAETIAVDLTNAVCALLATQPEPGWVTFLCQLDPAKNGNLQSVTIRVQQEGAPAFAAAHAAKDAGGQ